MILPGHDRRMLTGLIVHMESVSASLLQHLVHVPCPRKVHSESSRSDEQALGTLLGWSIVRLVGAPNSNNFVGNSL